MFIKNIRLGFATNSSSTHSIILIDPVNNLNFSKYNKSDNNYKDGYGWEYFILSNEKQKIDYLAVQLNETLKYELKLPEKTRSRLIKSLFKYDYLNEEENFDERYVDHNSYYTFPRTSIDKIDKDFIFDLIEYIKKDDKVIIGGNDNYEPPDKISKLLNKYWVKNVNIGLKPRRDGITKSRKDKISGDWTLFNTLTGTKFRFNFNDCKPSDKTYYPELVDMKITNYCDFKCEYCYQNSSNTLLNHANFEYIKKVIKCLSDIGIFEIALGGGDPIMHPNFIEILEECRNNFIVPNFSTRNIQWIKDEQTRNKILELVGSVGISINSKNDIENIYSYIDKQDYKSKNKLKFQYVVGSEDEENFKNLIDYVYDNRIPLLLLGFKNVGRGKEFTKFEFNSYEIIKQKIENMKNTSDYFYYELGVDTSMINELLNLSKNDDSDILNLETNKYFFNKDEGSSSMYIDCVNNVYSKSSFDPETYPINNIEEHFEITFSKYLDM